MTSASIAIATHRAAPNLNDDEQLLVSAAVDAGLNVNVEVWNDTTVKWNTYDAVIVRQTWDYHRNVETFRSWVSKTQETTRLLNPGPMIRWNIDKGYLGVLSAAGVPTIPTNYISPGGYLKLPTETEFVIKPAISASAEDTARYDPQKGAMTAVGHAQALLEEGRTVMVQPYVRSVDERGESSLVFFGGRFSHAVKRGAVLQVGKPALKTAEVTPHSPSMEELGVAQLALSAIPDSLGNPLYARVDIVQTVRGPMILELELIEPALYFTTNPIAAARFSEAITARLQRPE